jgi:hypothetical protein
LPVTTPDRVWVAAGARLKILGLMAMAVTARVGMIVSVAEALLLESATLVAVMVAVPVVPGAV